MFSDEFDTEIVSKVQTEANLLVDSSVIYPVAPLSEAAKEFLVGQGEDPEIITQLPVLAAIETSDSFPLRDYYISSSHNTYLLSRQLIGISSAAAYTYVLKHGARCVEIDVWPHPRNAREPVVTHGYTFSKSVPFREVCQAINEGVQPNEWPVFISLECHVPAAEQQQLVDIMKETWGEKLLDAALEDVESNAVSPGELKGRILLIVEYYPKLSEQVVESADDQTDSSSSSESDENSSDSSESLLLRDLRKKQSVSDYSTISPELAALGVYAKSIKPRKGWLSQIFDPELSILINISESAISKLIPVFLGQLIQNATQHLRRVYPRGTRIRSSNLNPLKCWGTGSQIAALNWQTFDTGIQLNEAMFVGSPGWVLKDLSLREEDRPASRERTFISCHAFGVSGLSVPKEKNSIRTCIKAELFTPSEQQVWKSQVVHSEIQLNVDFQGVANPVWDETFVFETENRRDNLVFIRLSIDEVGLLRSTKLGVFCARVSRLKAGWRIVRLLAPSGVHAGSTLLLNFSF